MAKRKNEKLITIEQVAELTGLAVKTIRARAAGTRDLLRVRMGRRTMFSAAQVQEWINQRVQAARIEQNKEAQREQEPEEEPEPANVIRMAAWLSREEITREIVRADETLIAQRD